MAIERAGAQKQHGELIGLILAAAKTINKNVTQLKKSINVNKTEKDVVDLASTVWRNKFQLLS